MEYRSGVEVQFIDKMGDDARIAMAAWVSTSAEAGMQRAKEKPDDVEGVINYLLKHKHGTPFEAGALQFFVKAPIFVWREWHRHRIGFCLAGDTEIWTESYGRYSGRTVRKQTIADLWDLWNNGTTDSWGRTRHLRSIKTQQLRVLNEQTHLFELGNIKDVFKSGMKEVFHLETMHPKWNSIHCSKDHGFLTPDGWVKLEELSANDSIYVSGKRNANELTIPKALREQIGIWTSMQRVQMIRPYDYCYICNQQYFRENLNLDHVVSVVADLSKALDKKNLKPICLACHQIKSNSEQALSSRNIVAGSNLVKLRCKPERVREEETFDIEMHDPWHNFVANGIIVHNSYNEESARYKVLEPCFYIPSPERPMIKVDDWKPGRPKFLTLSRHIESLIEDKDQRVAMKQASYSAMCADMRQSYENSYQTYLRQLERKLDPGLARDVLPVGIYSSCWVTCNPRSIMHFLSLRTHDPKANHVSYPLWEMQLAAGKVEEMFASYWPVTYNAFLANGREGP